MSAAVTFTCKHGRWWPPWPFDGKSYTAHISKRDGTFRCPVCGRVRRA